MTHRFIAPVARIGVASKDGRILGGPAAQLLRDGGPVPVSVHLPHAAWTGCGRITGAGVLDDLLILSGTIGDPAVADLLRYGQFFLSIAVTSPAAAEAVPAPDELSSFGWSQEYPITFEGWTVQYALAASSEGRPWDLPDTLVWEAS